MANTVRLDDVIRVVRQLSSGQPVAGTQARSEASAYIADPRRASLSDDGRYAIDDAVHAFGCGLYASAVTLAWNALIDLLHERCARDAFSSITPHLSVKGGVHTKEQARDVMDGAFIDACYAAGLIRNQDKRLLSGMLNERNMASHPGHRWVGHDFALHFIERVLTQAARLSPPP